MVEVEIHFKVVVMIITSLVGGRGDEDKVCIRTYTRVTKLSHILVVVICDPSVSDVEPRT